MKLNEAVEYAAQWLPEIWQLNIYVERGAAEVCLINDEFDCIDRGPVCSDESFAQAVERLVKVANPSAAPWSSTT